MPKATDTEDTDPERVVRLTAHAIARIADRIPFSRRLSRHMEGTENRAGLLSDVLALLAELLRRNPELVEHKLQSFGNDLKQARAAQAAANNGGTSSEIK